MSGSLTALSLAEARDGLGRRKFSARELTESYIRAVEAARPLNAFITETPDHALMMAEAADERRARGHDAGRSTASRSRSKTSTAPRAC